MAELQSLCEKTDKLLQMAIATQGTYFKAFLIKVFECTINR